MECSDFKELSKPVYAKNSVVQMMSGHAYKHTLRAHFPTQQASTSILLSQSSVTQICKIYEDGQHGERCMANAVQEPGVVTRDQQFMQKRAW